MQRLTLAASAALLSAAPALAHTTADPTHTHGEGGALLVAALVAAGAAAAAAAVFVLRRSRR